MHNDGAKGYNLLLSLFIKPGIADDPPVTNTDPQRDDFKSAKLLLTTSISIWSIPLKLSLC